MIFPLHGGRSWRIIGNFAASLKKLHPDESTASCQADPVCRRRHCGRTPPRRSFSPHPSSLTAGGGGECRDRQTGILLRAGGRRKGSGLFRRLCRLGLHGRIGQPGFRPYTLRGAARLLGEPPACRPLLLRTDRHGMEQPAGGGRQPRERCRAAAALPHARQDGCGDGRPADPAQRAGLLPPCTQRAGLRLQQDRRLP